MSRLILPSRKLWTPPQRQRGVMVLDAYRFGAGSTGINYLVSTENLAGPGWATGAATVSTNTALSPIGTLTADTLLLSSSSGVCHQGAAIPGGTSGAQLVFSAWLKTFSGSQNVQLKNTHQGVKDNYKTVTVTSTWQRFDFGVTNGAAAGTGVQIVGFYGSISPGIAVWGMQLEPGLVAGVYKPVT